MASKHAYLLTGSVVVLIGWSLRSRRERLASAAAVLVCCFVMLAAPIFVRNLYFYGDPLSPLLERWRPDGDPALEWWSMLNDSCGNTGADDAS